MCLYADKEIARAVKDDIVCYKVVRCSRCNDKYVLRSEYYDFNYRVGRLYQCYDFSKKAKRNIAWYDYYVVENGFHSYMKLDKALSHAEELLKLFRPTLAIVKCVIPKGSLMFSSADDGEYCSEYIKVIGYESFENVAKAVSERRSIEWKETLNIQEEPEHTEDNTEHGIHRIVKAVKSWMNRLK